MNYLKYLPILLCGMCAYFIGDAINHFDESPGLAQRLILLSVALMANNIRDYVKANQQD